MTLQIKCHQTIKVIINTILPDTRQQDKSCWYITQPSTVHYITSEFSISAIAVDTGTTTPGQDIGLRSSLDLSTS